MTTEKIIIKKITPKVGYLLTNGETTSNVIYVGENVSSDTWWEIPDPDYVPEYDGSDYLRPITWIDGIEVVTGLWYTDGVNIWEAIKDGVPNSFDDREYFDII